MENNEITTKHALLPLEIAGDIERQAYHGYLKQLDYMRRWRVQNREKYNNDMRERMRMEYKNNPEYRAKMNAYKKDAYYQKNMA